MKTMIWRLMFVASGALFNCSVASHLRNSQADSHHRNLQAITTEVGAVGGVTQNEAVIGFRTSASALVTIIYASNPRLRRPTETSAVTTVAADDFTGSIKLTGLAAATKYWYRIVVDGVVQEPDDGTMVQRFQTFPPEGTAVRISIFSDAAPYYNDRNALAYENGSFNPNKDGALVALQIGDFDHSDPTNIDEVRLMHRGLRDLSYKSGYDFSHNILSKMAFDHVYDDHDFCGNDSDGSCPHKADVLKAYDEYYPGYDRPYPDDGVYHNFRVSDAEVFVLDTRYNRDPSMAPNLVGKTMLGATQKQWLKDTLLASTASWKIIVSTVTANKFARPKNPDHWVSGFAAEANEMKEFLQDNGLNSSTILVSGDLHTGGGIDGGCNNAWGIPELTIAHTNLRRGNGAAVGRWSEGVTEGVDHMGYGSIYVDGDEITLESKDHNGNIMHSLDLPGPYNTTGCSDSRLTQCTFNVMSFYLPSSGDCPLVEQGNTYFPPLESAETNAYIDNEATWYECLSSGLRILRSNDIPDHQMVLDNPNKPCVQNIHAEFPLYPTVSGTMIETDNVIGFGLNGVLAFNPLEAGSFNAVEPADNVTGVQDAQYWYGHATTRNVWHYHSPFMGIPEEDVLVPDQLLGYAMDGFPIYGPVDDVSVLDECNFDAVTQRYHVRTLDQVDETLPYCNEDGTEATNWNYIIGCYRGNVDQSTIKDSTLTVLPADCVAIDTNIFSR